MKIAYKLGLILGAAITLLLVPARGRTEQLQKFGDVVVHYNALSSDQLPPEVAKTYGFQRSSRRGLINIAVQRDGTTPQPLAAAVKATAVNLAGQRTDVTMREIKEGDAVYYLGEFPVAGTDTLRFTVDVTPTGAAKALNIKFSKDYVTD